LKSEKHVRLARFSSRGEECFVLDRSLPLVGFNSGWPYVFGAGVLGSRTLAEDDSLAKKPKSGMAITRFAREPAVSGLRIECAPRVRLPLALIRPAYKHGRDDIL
jgi:hypothetical protein